MPLIEFNQLNTRERLFFNRRQRYTKIWYGKNFLFLFKIIMFEEMILAIIVSFFILYFLL